jgi:acyl carrier protein
MIDKDAVFPRLTQVFHAVFDDESIVVTEETTAHDVDDWDSVMHISLMVAVEKEFSMRLSAEEIGKQNKVGDLVDLIAARGR